MVHAPTIVIHGFFTPSATNLPVHVALRRRGVSTYDVPIPGLNTQSVERSSEVLAARVREVLDRTGAPELNLVGVSLGGVIAAHYVRVLEPTARVRRAVTLGSPFDAVKLAGLVGRLSPALPAARDIAPGSQVIRAIRSATDAPVEIVAIHAEGDAVVPPEAAMLPGARNLRAPIGNYPFAHYQLVVDPRNLAFMADALLD